jgi:hypothetical protein
MKTRTQRNLNVPILNLYCCNYIYTTMQEKKFTLWKYAATATLPTDELPDK